MIITIFEDQNHNSLFPLNQIKASFELRCGAFTNYERIRNNINFDDEIHFFVRNEIKEIIQERYPDVRVNPDILCPGIWLNGCALWSKDSIKSINSSRTYTNKGRILAIDNHESVSISEIFL